MKEILTNALSLLIVLTLSATSLFAQAPIKKPEKKNATTTTPQKPRTNTNKNTNKSSQTKTSTNTNTQTSTNTTTTKTSKPKTDTNTQSSSSSTSTSMNTQGNSNRTTTTTTIAPKPITGTITGHEWVDLGLSVKWATCNVGASSPSDYGDYYAWGETITKTRYTEKNSITYGKNMGSIAGDPAYDAARANWGGTWRLPTESEIDELKNKCKRTWTTQGGHKGYKITGRNGNSIFLPAAGWRSGRSLNCAGEIGSYWRATPDKGNVDDYFFVFDSDYFVGRDWNPRYIGGTVRPVTE